MWRLRVFLARLYGSFAKNRFERELQDELHSHLDMLVEAGLRQGMTKDEARNAALRELGGVERAREAYRDQRGFPGVESLVKDLGYAFRLSRREPAFTAVAIFTLALAIGANTAIFTVLNAVMLRSLPAKDAQRLVFLSDPDRHGVNGGQESGERRLFAYSEFEWLRDHNGVFSGIFAVTSTLSTIPVSLEGGGPVGAEPARVACVSGDYFSALGIRPYLGRFFGPEVDRWDHAAPIAVISSGFWKRHLGGDPAAIGTRMRIRRSVFEIVGVTPSGFSGETVGTAPDVWIPLTVQTELPREALLSPKDVRNKYMWLQVMARLKPEITRQQAEASINVTLQQLLLSEATTVPSDQRDSFLNQRIAIAQGARGASTLRSSYGMPLLILTGLVGLVLLIACANVANLLLARAARREREMAVRVALGAGRGRLIQQSLIESLLLALAGGAAGLVLAQWVDSLLLNLISTASSPIALDLHLDARILAFTAGASIITALLFGAGPALRSTRVDLNCILKGSSKGAGGAAARVDRRGGGLVIGQVALSLLLLIVAGLFVRSFQKLTATDLGYDASRILQFAISPAADNYKGPPDQLHRELLERIRQIPGVQGASLSLSGLFSGTDLDMNISIDGWQAGGLQETAVADYIGPAYFSTAGIPVLAGRELGTQDEGNSPLVGVINQTMAQTFFGDENPIGKRIRATSHPITLAFEVVGVVADSRHDDVKSRPGSCFFVPFFNSVRDKNFSWAMHEVRFTGDPVPAVAAIRGAVDEEAPLMDSPQIRTLDEVIGDTVSTERMIATLSSAFGVLALTLASVGLYGLTSYGVARRRKEIGIRMALGARRTEITVMVVRETFRLVLIGVLAALPGLFGASRLISAYLYEVSSIDPVAFLLPVTALMLVATFAGLVPAWQASRVDPMIALRCD